MAKHDPEVELAVEVHSAWGTFEWMLDDALRPGGDDQAPGLPPQLAVDNRMVVPVGVPIRIQAYGADVIHSFFVPEFRLKEDCMPGRENHAWFETTRDGTFNLYCAEYCGDLHSQMLSKVVSLPPAQFDRWLEDNQGNVFYQTKDGKRRWVIFNGEAEASRVDPEAAGLPAPGSRERPRACLAPRSRGRRGRPARRCTSRRPRGRKTFARSWC